MGGGRYSSTIFKSDIRWRSVVRFTLPQRTQLDIRLSGSRSRSGRYAEENLLYRIVDDGTLNTRELHASVRRRGVQ